MFYILTCRLWQGAGLHHIKYGYSNPFFIRRYIFLESFMGVATIMIEICCTIYCERSLYFLLVGFQKCLVWDIKNPDILSSQCTFQRGKNKCCLIFRNWQREFVWLAEDRTVSQKPVYHDKSLNPGTLPLGPRPYSYSRPPSLLNTQNTYSSKPQKSSVIIPFMQKMRKKLEE